MTTDLAGLHDQLEPWQLFNQLPRDVGALTDQHDDIGVFEPHRQLTYALDRVGVNLGGEIFKFAGTLKFAYRVLIVVEDDNVHPAIVPANAR